MSNNLPCVIGLRGRKGAGKDRLYQNLKEELSFLDSVEVFRLSFGDFVKKEVSEACGVTLETIEQKKEIFRPILQWWGYEFRRQMTDPDYWIKLVRPQISKILQDHPGALVVLTDVRFQNEIDLVRQYGGPIVFIRRKMPIDPTDKHLSETDAIGEKLRIDYVIENNEGIAEFRNKTSHLIEWINQWEFEF